MKRMLMLGLLLLAGHAGAQSIYKCDSGDGVAYQATPCAGAMLQRWEHADAIAVPGGALTRAEAERRIETTRRAWQASATPRREPRTTRRLQAPRVARRTLSDCERARAARSAAHARRGLRWSFDDASRWDAKVFKVCR
jgi:hypothetical protein